jgi:6-phosphofructokinase 1
MASAPSASAPTSSAAAVPPAPRAAFAAAPASPKLEEELRRAGAGVQEGDHGFRFEGVATRVLDGSGEPPLPAMSVSTLVRIEVPRLQALCPEGDRRLPNTREPLPSYGDAAAAAAAAMVVAAADSGGGGVSGGGGGGDSSGGDGPSASAREAAARVPYLNVIDDSHVILGDIVRHGSSPPTSRCWVRAGPRALCYFEPHSVVAAVVTCGGLCPGLNNVVREIVLTLHNTYGARRVYGVQKGYWGFHTPDADLSVGAARHPSCPSADAPVLTPEGVAGINTQGGTVLGADRGGLSASSVAADVDVILRFCANRGINQLYVIGGDGTHRGASSVALEAQRRRVPLAVAAIPKTIDNDVDIIDRSFGFETAYSEAQQAIRSAKTEAASALNGLGIGKLRGRHAGFIAAHAAMASGDVDLCLIPEVPVVFTGPASFGAHVLAVMRRKGHAVVVVAEGAGEKEILAEQRAAATAASAAGGACFDAGGNALLPEVGPWLKAKLSAYLTERGCRPICKYIDPSYMIRSVAAHAADAEYCMLLGQNAVHGAMAGFTGFSTGLVNNRMAYIPISAITANSPRKMNARGRTYERLLQITRQPDPLQLPEVYGEAAAAAR